MFGDTLIEDLKGKHVSIDGKRIRGSKSSNSFTHILSAWVNEQSICLAGETVDEKSNEITAIPELLDSIDLSAGLTHNRFSRSGIPFSFVPSNYT